MKLRSHFQYLVKLGAVTNPFGTVVFAANEILKNERSLFFLKTYKWK